MSNSQHEQIAERIYRLKQEVALQSVQDPEFRAALTSDPKAALAEEYGLDRSFFDNIKVRVAVEEADELMLVIPGESASDELTDEQLESVAGGAAFIAAVAAGAAVVSTVAAVATVGVGVAAIVQNTRAGRQW